ncbi:hypothetical protein GGE06_007545 [Streptomyces sp. SFB5A]|uniref:Uncharacterized protein n=1 Tax=Streptomyces nymphaeiformis TaxID=2663842 RepID=A0A7W7U992_9ACTN|nr:hypothetical protein [Streptomyces nymphaeiformis]
MLGDGRRHILDTVTFELDSNRSPAQDSYTPTGVYDFTRW